MTKHEIDSFGRRLAALGYSRYDSRNPDKEGDWRYSKSFRNGDRELYLVIFRFWDFEQFKTNAGYSFDVQVICQPDYGRADMILSNWHITEDFDVEYVERMAKGFYELVK